MIRRGNAHIVNVSSTSGRTHQPLFSVYAATKHGLGAFTEVLRKEVHPNRIHVTLFEPGPTESELGSHADPEVISIWRLMDSRVAPSDSSSGLRSSLELS